MLQAHQTIDDFEIVRLLGKGGMGEVYEAEQKNPRRSVALKVLAPWLARDDDALDRFWREASVPARLDHPGIVRIISMGKTDDGIAYYTMHLVRGISLTEFIREGKHPPQPSTLGYTAGGQATPSQRSDNESPHSSPTPVPLAPAPGSSGSRPPLLKQYFQDRYATLARVGAMAARVLASAHGQGFLHRDVKPSNLMIDQHDHLYLVDFGLTRALDPAADGTRAGIVVGTPWYMSPEQAQGQPVDVRSDIYSLGITLYELASGGVGPFTASRENSQSVLEQVRAGVHLPLRPLAPDIPRPLEDIIERCIRLSPKKRYQRAADLASDLESYLGQSASRPKAVRTAPPRIGKRAHVAVALLGCTAILVAILLWRNATEPSDNKPDNGGDAGANAANVQSKAHDKQARVSVLPPLPDMLNKRAMHVWLPLLDANHEPLFKNARLTGKGEYSLTPHQLMLADPGTDVKTLLALDDDPQRHWFRFAIDLNHLVLPNQSHRNQMGVFFGWRTTAEPGAVPPWCYVVQMDEQPLEGFPHGQVLIGVSRIDPGHKMRTAHATWFRALPASKSTLALGKLKPGDWHRLEIEALEQRVKISVGERYQEFDVNWLRRQESYEDAPDPRGALGIWAGNGMAWFKDAKTMALAK